MKKLYTLAIAALCCLFLGCSESDPAPETPPGNSPPPVLLSRENPICFTAGASESFEVEVTTSLPWEVQSDKTWCVVTKVENRAAAGKFTVTAAPNTSGAAPEQATITILAGGKSYVALTVTQAAALLEYPTTIEALMAAINKTWIFESGEYTALLLSQGGYSLIPRGLEVRSSANAAPVPVVSGGFSVDRDLKTLTLRDTDLFEFATLKFVELTDASAVMEFTHRGGGPQRLSARVGALDYKQASSRKLMSFSADLGDGELTYDCTWSGNKLTRVQMTARAGGRVAQSANYVVEYPASNRMSITLTGTDDEGTVMNHTAFFQLNSDGLASSMSVRDNATETIIASAAYRYSQTGRMFYSEQRNKVSWPIGICQTDWMNGDPATEYRKYKIEWDEDKDGHPDHDFNGDGVIDGLDVNPWMYEKEVYEFSSTPNKAGVMLPFETFEVFAADDYGFGYVASLTGKMGLGSAHLLSSADREFVYQFDKEGYPVKVEVRDEESPEDNFTCTMRFDWPN